jgi:toxin ParE1/3/4
VARVYTSSAADADLLEIAEYLRNKAGNVTLAEYEAAFSRVIALFAAHPEIGAPRPKLGRSIRLNVVDPYNVYSEYDPTTDTVTVLRVLHGRRKITRRMMRPN